MNIATIYIRVSQSGKYFWDLCLSENSKEPSCKSPNEYVELTKCRRSAIRFAKHLTGKIKLRYNDEVVILDTIGDKRKKANLEIVSDGVGG